MSSKTLLRPAVFLDRDGTLIEDRGHLARPSEVVFFPDTVPALRRLQETFLLFIVTNQSGVAQGVVTIDEVCQVNAYVCEQLARHSVNVVAVYACPHQRTDGCECIKPKPYFLQMAAKEHGIDLRRSFTVGDHPHDVGLARAVGARGVYVRTGHGERHLEELSTAEVVVPGIREAADWILTAQRDDRPWLHEPPAER